jgi:putative endonuclease
MKEEFVVYILQSEKSGRLYIGYTKDIARRKEEHNSGQTTSTRNKGPWKILYTKAVDSKDMAIILEKKLKSWKNKKRVLSWIKREKLTKDGV